MLPLLDGIDRGRFLGAFANVTIASPGASTYATGQDDRVYARKVPSQDNLVSDLNLQFPSCVNLCGSLLCAPVALRGKSGATEGRGIVQVEGLLWGEKPCWKSALDLGASLVAALSVSNGHSK